MRIDLSVLDIDGAERDVAVQAADAASPAALARALGFADRLLVGMVLGRPRPDSSGGDARLDVVGGADSGRSLRIARGSFTIGREPSCDLVLSDPRVSRVHAVLSVTDAGSRLDDLGSTNGTLVNGSRVAAGGVLLQPGHIARVGDTFLALSATTAVPAVTRTGSPGRVVINRRPRPARPQPQPAIILDAMPTEHVRAPVQWLAALVPAVAGVGLAIAFDSAQFLVFAVLSPLALLASAGSDRWHWRRIGRRSRRHYERELIRTRSRIARGLDAEADARRAAQPDPARVARIAHTPLEQLWERGREDDDVLQVRLGLTSAFSQLQTVLANQHSPAGEVDAVPLTIDLSHGPLGIAGPRRVRLGLAYWLVGQLATQASPVDLEIVALLSDDAERCWIWLRWLPHLRGRVATSAAQRERLYAELAELIATRKRTATAHPPWVVVLIDRATGLGDPSRLADLLHHGPGLGVTAVCLDDRETGLPASCRVVASFKGSGGAELVLGNTADARPAVPDQVDEQWAERLARALAPVEDPSTDAATVLPDECRLVDLLNPDLRKADLQVAAVLDGWRRSAGGADAIVGASAAGPVIVDLDRDGPHALVAGTTGAGKSELLQTLVLSLALAHPPDETSFVLVDYKGGSAFADCARLPHTSGLVTDLDEALTQRALQSLGAELRRREQLFADACVADLAAYRADRSLRPVARLILVVDEFATLAAELPGFVDGLVGVAQRGRSLGVHLVLATQRPAGVVSPNIRANAALRIALRVTDPADSSDVIDTTEAAQLDRRHPGRALLRRGGRTVLMQVASVSAPCRPAAPDLDEVLLTALGPWRSLPPEAESAGAPTDLSSLVDCVVTAAQLGNYPSVERPWLPPLPALVDAGSLRRHATPDAAPTTLLLGLVDLPHEQRRAVLDLDLAQGASLLLIGGPRSGRSSALLSLAAEATRRNSPRELEVYAVDGSSGGLRALSQLPHAGAILTLDDVDVVDLLLRRLVGDAIDGARRTPGATTPKDRRPIRVLLIDGWEAFADAGLDYDGGQLNDRLFSLLREGPRAGVTVAVSGGRGALAPSIAGQFTTRLVLRLNDPNDWALAGLAAPTQSRLPGPGRARRLPDGAEIQLSVPGAGATTHELSRALQRRARRWQAAAPGAAIRIRALPTHVGLPRSQHTPGRWLLGVGGATADPIHIDLFAGAGRLLIAGPPRSGRSSLLRSLLIQATRGRHSVRVAAPVRSPLRRDAAALGIAVFGPDDGLDDITALIPAGHEPTLLLVDDGEAFIDCAVGDVLAGWARSQRQGLVLAVAARAADLAVTFRGVAAEVRRHQCGVLLQPGPVDGELLGVRLPRSRRFSSPGRGVLVGDPAWGAACASGPVPIQLALPDVALPDAAP